MNDCMYFPGTVEEFMEQYKVIDTDGIYMSKGCTLVPIFRMKQWFEHLQKSCDDTISRQVAIDALDEIRHALWEIVITSPTVPEYVERHKQVQSVWKLLDKKQKELYVLPSAQPERTRFADEDHVWIDGKQYISLQRFQQAVKEAQPDIIRCRDCVKCQYDTLFDKYWCKGREVREDFYCGDAERRTDEPD